MHITTSYPFNDEYVRFELRDDQENLIGSIEGVPCMIAIEVEEQYRRRGYGTLLVNAIKTHFGKDKSNVLVAETSGDDAAAGLFWASSCGFTPNSRDPDTYNYSYQ